MLLHKIISRIASFGALPKCRVSTGYLGVGPPTNSRRLVVGSRMRRGDRKSPQFEYENRRELAAVRSRGRSFSRIPVPTSLLFVEATYTPVRVLLSISVSPVTPRSDQR